MANENTNPEAINPGVDPELPQPDTTVIPVSSIDTTPAEVNPENDAELPQPDATPVVDATEPVAVSDEDLRAAQIADYRATYGEAVPLPTELSGLTENERQIQLWELKYPGVPAPTDYTGQSEEDRQRQLFEIQYPGQPYPYDIQAPTEVDSAVDPELPQPDATPVVDVSEPTDVVDDTQTQTTRSLTPVDETTTVTSSPYIRLADETDVVAETEIITEPADINPTTDPGILTTEEDTIVVSQLDTNVVEVNETNLVENPEPYDIVVQNEDGFVETRGLLIAPDEIPVEQNYNDDGTLVEFTENGEQIVDSNNQDFLVQDGDLRILAEDIPVEERQLEDGTIVEFTENGERIVDEEGFVVTEGGLRVLPEDIPEDATTDEEPELTDLNGESVAEASRAQAALDQARQQATVSAMRKANGQAVGDGDWRVRLRLAPNAYYLYKSDAPGIMEPLQATDGVIFPYTPKIDTVYSANYNPTELTHSNYTGYFYKGSKVGEIVMNAQFTAQDSKEANYLLATIHFFKSCTKMFYGQDNDRGAPPPLVFLSGLGEYQYNEHPCVISSFNYSLPDDVDYIRARGRQVSSAGITQGGNGLMWQRTLTSSTAPSYSLSSIWSRLTGANLPKGGQNVPPPPPNLGLNSPTYVPTKMNISLTLLPMNTRSQVAQQFSLEKYANGNLLRGGYW